MGGKTGFSRQRQSHIALGEGGLSGGNIIARTTLKPSALQLDGNDDSTCGCKISDFH